MERCQDHDKLCETVSKIDLSVARMEVALTNAIQETTKHIAAGTKYRLTILCACIGLVGSIIGGIIRFSLMEYKVAVLQVGQDKIQEQIFDLNYIKGRTEGIAEAAK